MRIAFPHNIMAGPLIPLALAGDLSDVSFASFGLSHSPDPYWIPPKVARMGTKLPQFCNREDDHPFVAQRVKNLLDDRKADMMLSWSRTVDSWPDIYWRVAQVSFGLTNLSLAVFRKPSAPVV